MEPGAQVAGNVVSPVWALVELVPPFVSRNQSEPVLPAGSRITSQYVVPAVIPTDRGALFQAPAFGELIVTWPNNVPALPAVELYTPIVTSEAVLALSRYSDTPADVPVPVATNGKASAWPEPFESKLDWIVEAPTNGVGLLGGVVEVAVGIVVVVALATGVAVAVGVAVAEPAGW